MKKIIAFAALALGLAVTGRLWATEVTWKESVASGGWHTGANWNGNYAPGSADTAVFNSDATVTFSTPSKTADNHITCVKITSGATVTFKCDDGVVFYPKTFEGSASETVILDGATFSVDGQNMTIPVTLTVKDETVNTFKLGNKSDRSITISGNMTGSGTLYIDFINENKSNGVTFSGNNENFSGKVEVINTSGQTDYSSFANASATSANATWNLVGAGMNGSYNVNKEMLTTKPSAEGSEMVTYEFGSISNIFTIGNNGSGLTVSDSVSGGSISRTIVNIGGNNEDGSTAGCFGWATLHKKGTGKLEFSAKYPYAVFIDAGTLYIADSDSAPQDGRLIFNGDGATLATSTSLDISKYGTKQPLKGNATYPICFSNATSEVHYWATQLDSSNTAGLRKIGDGSLHLGAAPGYGSLPIAVEGGTLAVNGSVNAANITLKPADPAAAASAGTVLFWAKTVSSGTPTLDSSLTALYRLKTTTDASLTINGTEYTGTAYSIEKRGGFVIMIARN